MALTGKLALVTGSTSGIGLGVAKVFAKEGAKIILHGFGDKVLIQNLKNEFLNAYNTNVFHSKADLTKVDEIEEMIKSSPEIDILVNNAGIQFVSNLDNFPVEKWDFLIKLNLTSVFHTTRLTLPLMKKRNWGRIINIASVHGLVGSIEKSAYVAAKHGVVGLTKVTALETAKTGVTCNCICPGYVNTPLVEKQFQDKAKEFNLSYEETKTKIMSEKQPSGNFVTTENIGALALFLASENANEVRGAAWTIDGGWTAQ
jgi:3-hydroxybutyrate dehydrogenase